MNRTYSPAHRARFLLWCAAAAACPLYYWLRTEPFPRRTPVGVERRLFAAPETANVSVRSTPSGDWLVTADWGEPPAPTPGVPTDLSGWLILARAQFQRVLAAHTGARPPLAPLPRQGTWELEGSNLRYRWRLAGEPRGAHYLWAYNYSDGGLGPLGAWVYDLRTGHSYRSAAAEQIASQWTDEEFDGAYWSAEMPLPLAPALDDMPPAPGETRTVELTAGRVHLTGSAFGESGADLYARSDDAAPRSLRLAGRAALIDISQDGRTLFLRRGASIWRLDLRKPLPELLREVPLPELPHSPHLQ